MKRVGGANPPRADALPATTAPATPAFESTAPFAIEPTMGATVGAQIGRYVIRHIVGFGGMGLVVAAHDSELSRMVAIKLVAGDDEQARRRLVREAQAMARLSHPNVVTVHEVIRFGERAGIVMELVEGDNLAVWCDAQPRSWREIVAAYVQAARGLAAAHRAGLVHRDFKPSNALIDREGVVRVTDFGLVRSTVEREALPEDAAQLAQGSVLDMTLTRTGAMMGTPAYMAPEQHAGEAVDERTDQWALACSLYTALNRQRPFAGNTQNELSASVLAGELRPEPSDTEVPRAIRAAIRRALSRRPADRFPSIDDLVAALAPRRRRWHVALAAGLVVLLGAVLALAAAGSEEETCAGIDTPLDSIWNRSRADGLRARFASAGQSAVAARVVDALDGHGARWNAARTGACTEARQGVGSPDRLDRRMRCLDQRLLEMSVVIDALQSGDAKTLRGASEAVDRLHQVTDCADLRDTVPRPADPDSRAKIAEVEDTLARGWALHALGHHDRALPLARRAVTGAEAIGWRPLLARALILRGECEDRQRVYPAALASYEQAATVAAQAQDDASVVQALAGRFLVLGEHLGRPGEALEGRRYIELALERAGRPPRLRALWLHYLAIMLHARGEQDDALAAEVEAVSIWRQLVAPGHVLLVDSLETQGNIQIARGEHDRAEELLREVLAAKIATRGTEHLAVADTHTNLGVLEGTRGNLLNALDQFERAVAIGRAAGSEDCIAVYDIGYVRIELMQWRAAAEVLEQAVTCMERHRPGDGSGWIGETRTSLAAALTRLGELDRAAPLFESGLAALRKAGLPSIGGALAGGARLALLRGDREAARAMVAEAMKLGEGKDASAELAAAELARVEHGCRAALAGYERAARLTRIDAPSLRADARTGQAECLIELGRPAEAVAALEPEASRLEQVGAELGAGARIRFALARALPPSERRRARELAAAARAGFAELGAPGQLRAAEVTRWLARRR